MLKDIVWPDDRTYSSESSYEPIEFYLRALSNSNRFDLLLGYFSTAAIKVLSCGFASFLYNGGKMRVIANNVLSAEDADIIKNAESIGLEKNFIDLKDFNSVKNKLDDYGIHFFKCISWLIANKNLEIVLIKPKGKKGIAHYKTGIFYDDISKVAFRASCNFTAFGLLENLEDLDIYLEDTPSQKIKIQNQEKRFEEIFSGKSDIVDYIDSTQIEIAIKEIIGDKDVEISELLVDEKKLLNRIKASINTPKLNELITEILGSISDSESSPRFPYPSGPFPYQVEAYKNWLSNNKTGLFAMATGTGKTLTSLYCLIEDFKNNKIQRNIVIVPGKELVEQWFEEMRNCNFSRPVRWYSGNSKLKNDIDRIKLLLNSEKSKINIITTYDSFSSANFLQLLGNKLSSFSLIFDEAHNMGAAGFMKSIKNIEFGNRIGLSATPLRLWDENEENLFIENFFNSPHPYTFSYSMKDAIKNGFLCKYKYEPFFVSFTDEEWNDYLILTSKIPISREREKINTTAALKRQLKKDQAVNKNLAVLEIIRKLIDSDNYKNTLIYCPKGASESNDEKYIEILRKKIKRNFPELNLFPFTSETSNRDLVLKDFESELVHMLLAIKCLDEGVNIPKTMNAIFIASGQNYREFVQRRGRILRNYSKGDFKKEFASIFDVVILPTVTQYTNNKKIAERLIVSEFTRLFEFYDLAIKDAEIFRKINVQLNKYNLTEAYIRNLVKT